MAAGAVFLAAPALPAAARIAGRRRRDIRVMVSMSAMASAMRPTTWAVTTGIPRGSSEVVGSAFVLLLLARLPAPGAGLGESDGLICGNRPEASPGLMSELPALFRAGIGPTGMFDVAPVRPLPAIPPSPTDEVPPLLLDDGDDLPGALT